MLFHFIGVGKSSVADVLLGQSPQCDDCIFPICPGADSCTKTTGYAFGPWLGNASNQNFTVVDTPGKGVKVVVFCIVVSPWHNVDFGAFLPSSSSGV